LSKLSVNVDHVATVRQARMIDEPDPVVAAGIAEIAGAEGITVHLREDRRHIQDRDVKILRETVKTRLNLEMAATDEMVGIALEVRPDMVTIVPEKRAELTTEGGLDVISFADPLSAAIKRLKLAGIQVNLFIDPTQEAVKASHRVDADGVELHTGSYANNYLTDAREAEFTKISESARFASKLGLAVHAGHGLDYRNVGAIREIAEIEEYAIGFSIIAQSVFVGLDRAVRDMVELVR
jgi:pyridoxine 5-phosphate synthase